MLALYAFIALYLSALRTKERWMQILATLCYSAALSVKMNVLLYLPALGLLYLQSYGFWSTAAHCALIAVTQAALALPFLLHFPREYLMRSFDFGRQFLFKWTVNWKFLPEDVFLSKQLATGTLSVLVPLHRYNDSASAAGAEGEAHYPCELCACGVTCRSAGGSSAVSACRSQQNVRQPQLDTTSAALPSRALFRSPAPPAHVALLTSVRVLFRVPGGILGVLTRSFRRSGAARPLPSPRAALSLLFVCNFLGILFARSLHFQFYVWYFHSLPFILFGFLRGTLPFILRAALLAGIEVVWNIYPSRAEASLVLLAAHATIAAAIVHAVWSGKWDAAIGDESDATADSASSVNKSGGSGGTSAGHVRKPKTRAVKAD
jgi:alpha-1,3-mannosyltransferase